MASRPIVEGDGAREKQRYTESKVYTRKAFKGPKKKNNSTITTTNSFVTNNTAAGTNDQNVDTINHNNNPAESTAKPPVSEDANWVPQQQQFISSMDAAVLDCLSSSPNRQQQVLEARTLPTENGAVTQGVKVHINLTSDSKQEMLELKMKLDSELAIVRSLLQRIEAEQYNGFGIPPISLTAEAANDRVYERGVRALTRVHSEVASGGCGVQQEVTRPFQQLRVSVLENSSVMSENVERQKHTPKANSLYRNSEFLLAKDKFPPAESNKKSKSKSNGKKQEELETWQIDLLGVVSFSRAVALCLRS